MINSYGNESLKLDIVLSCYSLIKLIYHVALKGFVLSPYYLPVKVLFELLLKLLSNKVYIIIIITRSSNSSN